MFFQNVSKRFALHHYLLVVTLAVVQAGRNDVVAFEERDRRAIDGNRPHGQVGRDAVEREISSDRRLKLRIGLVAEHVVLATDPGSNQTDEANTGADLACACRA